jgi:hypothetical protein
LRLAHRLLGAGFFAWLHTVKDAKGRRQRLAKAGARMALRHELKAFRRWIEYLSSSREQERASCIRSLEQQLQEERALARELKDETVAMRHAMEQERASVCHQVEERLCLADGALKEASQESQSILDQAASAVAAKADECTMYAARLEDCQAKNLRLMAKVDELSLQLDRAAEEQGAFKGANASLQEQLRQALEQLREAWDVQNATEVQQVPLPPLQARLMFPLVPGNRREVS